MGRVMASFLHLKNTLNCKEYSEWDKCFAFFFYDIFEQYWLRVVRSEDLLSLCEICSNKSSQYFHFSYYSLLSWSNHCDCKVIMHEIQRLSKNEMRRVGPGDRLR